MIYNNVFLLLFRSVPLEKDVDWESEIGEVAKEISGFSGREISKLAIAWQVGWRAQIYVCIKEE